MILGTLDDATSPGTAYTPIVGADLALSSGAESRLPLNPDFEYAVLSMSGEAEVDGVPVLPGSMLYLGCGRTELPLRAESDAGLMLLGGEPFEEEIVMWWNFIGRSHEEIEEARQAWAEGPRFGEVHGYDGARLSAPTPAGGAETARTGALNCASRRHQAVLVLDDPAMSGGLRRGTAGA